MTRNHGHRQGGIGITFGGVLILVYCLFSGKWRGLSVYLLTAAIHEGGHIAAARFLKIPLPRLRLDLFGARLYTGTALLSYSDEAILAAAGPFSNLLSSAAAILAGMIFGFSPTAFVLSSLALAVFNLLPLPTFDGGRIFYCLLARFLLPEHASALVRTLGLVTLVILWGLSVFCILKTGFLSSLFVCCLCLFGRIFAAGDGATFSEDLRTKQRKNKNL